jgi:vacuolar-type H+-ATPase subunit D/Vma8
MMKARLAGAHKGHGLLKKKADALQMRFRLILGKIIEVSANFCNFATLAEYIS